MAAEIDLVLIIVLIIMAIGLAFSIGANDETIAPLVGAGVLKFKLVLILGGIAIGGGMLLFSGGFVPETVGQNLLGEGETYTNFMLLAVLVYLLLKTSILI